MHSWMPSTHRPPAAATVLPGAGLGLHSSMCNLTNLGKILFIHHFFPPTFYSTVFQPEHLNIKLNAGELFSLLILNYCKFTSSASSSTLK